MLVAANVVNETCSVSDSIAKAVVDVTGFFRLNQYSQEHQPVGEARSNESSDLSKYAASTCVHGVLVRLHSLPAHRQRRMH